MALSVVAASMVGLAPPASAGDSRAGFQAAPLVEAGPPTAGATTWIKRYNGPADRDDGATSVAVSRDGSTVFVTGGSTGKTSDYDYTTVAYRAATGVPLWVARYNGPGNGYDQATALGLSPDGSTVFVTGASLGATSDLDYATVAYDATTGSQRWATRSNGPGNGLEYAQALSVSRDGSTVFVTGYSPGSRGDDDYATVAYSSPTGRTIWERRYNGPGNDADEGRAVDVSPDGSTVFVTGNSVGSRTGTDYATIAYSAATGATVWKQRYNGPGNSGDLAHALRVSPDGSTVFVAGESIGSNGGFDYAALAYNASSGAQLWVNRYDGTAMQDDYATALGVSSDGSRVFVTGYSRGLDDTFDYATVAYSASSGAALWAQRYSGPGNSTDDANALAVSPDGFNVFVTGASIGSTGSVDYATLAYESSSGAQVWLNRYDGPRGGHDYAYALAASPRGSAVFVTGESTGPTGFLDYATLAYSAP
jgi:predicted RNA-binding protein with TRAM domain